MKKIIALILAVMMLALCLAGCGSKPAPAPEAPSAGGDEPAEPTSDPIEIVYWHTYTDHHQENLKLIIDKFNASQDKYVVIEQQQPYSEFDAKLLQSVSTGTGPDFAPMFASTAVNYKEDGYLYDFAQFINDPEIGIPDFKDQLAEGYYNEITQWGGDGIYLFPILFGSEVLYYNKTMLDGVGMDVPTTWEELADVSKAIKAEYGVPGFGTDSEIDTFQGWMIQSGSDYIDVANKQIAIDKDTAIEWLNWYAQGCSEGYFRLVGEDYYFSGPFDSQAVGMYVGSAAGVGYVLAGIPAEGEDGYFEVGCAPIPQGDVKYISSWGSTVACLSKDAEHAQGVYEFLKFMTRPEQLVDWAIAFGTVPAFRDSVEDARFQDQMNSNIAVKALVEEYDYANYLPAVLGADTVRNTIEEMFLSVVLGTADAETAFDNFVAAANAAMNDY